MSNMEITYLGIFTNTLIHWILSLQFCISKSASADFFCDVIRKKDRRFGSFLLVFMNHAGFLQIQSISIPI